MGLFRPRDPFAIMTKEMTRDFIKGLVEGFVEEEPRSKSEKSVIMNDTTKQLDKVLASFSTDYLKYSEEIENRCIRELEIYYDELLAILLEIPIFSNNTRNVNRVNRNKSKIKQLITGSVKEPLVKRMVLHDSECLEILRNDSRRNEEMRLFTNRIIDAALEKLSIEIQEVLDEQANYIEDYFHNLVEVQKKEVEGLNEQYDILFKNSATEIANMEKSCLKPLVMTTATELLESLF